VAKHGYVTPTAIQCQATPLKPQPQAPNPTPFSTPTPNASTLNPEWLQGYLAHKKHSMVILGGWVILMSKVPLYVTPTAIQCQIPPSTSTPTPGGWGS